MAHYRSNVRDLEFVLFEVLERQRLLGVEPYADVDADTAREMLHEVARLAENELAESLLDSDRNPPQFDPATGTVRLPESFRRSYQAYLDAEWWRTDVPPELGGTRVPPSLRWAIAELVLGANPAVHMYSAGFAFAKVLHRLGTPDQRRLAQHVVDHRWGATMVLTEPDAGSDVGAGRTKAVQQPDGTWHITGVKRFITSAEADLYDNVVHFVLARPEGAGPGTKGLSMFLVPKYHVDLTTGELGERNGVYVTNVEKKMGLKASTTCELTFGDKHPAIGTLDAGLRVVEGHQVAGRQRGDGLGAHEHPGVLDDPEHLHDAVVHLADQPALRGHRPVAEGQLAGRGDLQAHLLLDVGDVDAVALAERAGLEVDVELGDDEQ